MSRPLPETISASDALRAQVVRAATVCGLGLAEAAGAVAISADGLRSWLGRWTGSCAWPPDCDVLCEMLALPVARPRPPGGPVGRLAAIAEQLHDYPPGTLAGKSRARPIVRVRQAVCWAIRTHYGERWSYPMIGRALGGRDHSTVMHALRSAEAAAERDPDYAALCRLLLVHAGGTDPLPPLQPAAALPDWVTDPEGWLARKAARGEDAPEAEPEAWPMAEAGDGEEPLDVGLHRHAMQPDRARCCGRCSVRPSGCRRDPRAESARRAAGAENGRAATAVAGEAAAGPAPRGGSGAGVAGRCLDPARPERR